MGANPLYVLIGAALLLGVLLIVHVLRLPEPPRLEFESSQAAAARAETARPKPVTAAPKLSTVQKLVAIPYFGGWLELFLGVFLPFFVALHTFMTPLQNTRHESWVLFTFAGCWNLAFTRITKVRLTTPLIPVPLAVVAFALAAISAGGVWWR